MQKCIFYKFTETQNKTKNCFKFNYPNFNLNKRLVYQHKKNNNNNKKVVVFVVVLLV